MCGLFGVVRAEGAAHPQWVTDAVLLLGVLAEERGLDGAGYALLATAHAPDVRPRADAARFARTRVGPLLVVKGRGRFSQVWTGEDLTALNAARIVLGHTRWATQGAIGLLNNTSPLAVDGLVGTHNGDVDAAGLASLFGITDRRGDTDTEVLLAALAGARTPKARRLVLAAARGRAALAWVDAARPTRLWLARTAISPLAVAQDAEGNLWWASNPAWLRRVEQRTPIELVRSRQVAEGSLLSVDHGGVPKLVARGRFTATARASDARLADLVAYRGFTATDRGRDVAQRCCRIERPRRPAEQLTTRWSAEPAGTRWSSAGQGRFVSAAAG